MLSVLNSKLVELEDRKLNARSKVNTTCIKKKKVFIKIEYSLQELFITR